MGGSDLVEEEQDGSFDQEVVYDVIKTEDPYCEKASTGDPLVFFHILYVSTHGSNIFKLRRTHVPSGLIVLL